MRPYTAIFDWLFYQAGENAPVKDKIEASLQAIIDQFNHLKYLRRWYKRHDKWNLLTLDDADKLQTALRMLQFLGLEWAEGLMKIYTKVFGSPDGLPVDGSDRTLMEKAKAFLSHQSEYRYCILGHTQNPMQVPVRITSRGIEQMYLNTGTGRAKHMKGLIGGFITLKNLTYTLIYSQEENPNQEFESWTGSLKEVAGR